MAILGAGNGSGGGVVSFIIFVGIITMFISILILFNDLQFYPDGTLIQHKHTINGMFAGLMMVIFSFPLGVIIS